jgi:hypothetical protein
MNAEPFGATDETFEIIWQVLAVVVEIVGVVTISVVFPVSIVANQSTSVSEPSFGVDVDTFTSTKQERV